MPTVERLRELLGYCSETGVLTWKLSRGKARAGSRAGYCRGDSGYREMRMDGVTLLEHRVAYAHAKGVWPVQEVDHLNGIRSDNRIVNLRDVSCEVNLQNQRSARKTSQTGLLGANWDAQNNRFRASISVKGKKRALGSFLSADAAHAAYLNAKRVLHAGCTI